MKDFPFMSSNLIRTTKLHITMGLFAIPSNSSDEKTNGSIDQVVQALKEWKASTSGLKDYKSIQCGFKGLATFGRDIVYMEPIDDDAKKVACDIANDVKLYFEQREELQQFLVEDERDFVPHLTICKPKWYNRSKGCNNYTVDLIGYSDRFFGSERLTELDLCEISAASPDGYYRTHGTITLT